MAEANGAVEIRSPGPRIDYQGPLGTFGWTMAWLDYAVYNVEKALAVAALAVMIVIEFIYILFENGVSMKINFMRWVAGEGPLPYRLLVILGFVSVLMGAVVNHSRLGRTSDGSPRPLGVRLGATALVVAAVFGVGSLSVFLEKSSTFYLILTCLIMGPVVGYFFKQGKKITAGCLGALTLVLLWLSANVPDGYSWADKRSLFLLVWMGFLGASMTTKQKAHIKLDIARKFCPPKVLPWFNALSDLIVASFTLLLLYLSYLYMFKEGSGRWWANTLEGEIPDWLGVMAIPLALLSISARFLASAVLSVISPAPASGEGDAPQGEEVSS